MPGRARLKSPSSQDSGDYVMLNVFSALERLLNCKELNDYYHIAL